MVVFSTTLMKRKISVTVDIESLLKLRESMTFDRHKNKSQAVEYFLKRLLEDNSNED